MAKDKERQTAYYMYVYEGLTAKAISEKLCIAEKTISKWVNTYQWRDERTSREISASQRTQNIHQILDDLAADRLKLRKELAECERESDKETDEEQKKELSNRITGLRKSIWAIDDAVAKWNKRLESAEKETNVDLITYISVMDNIFKSLQKFDSRLYVQTLDFQKQHTQDIIIFIKKQK